MNHSDSSFETGIAAPADAPSAAPAAAIVAVPLATVPVPTAANDALVNTQPCSPLIATPVPAAPNNPVAPRLAAIAGAAKPPVIPTRTAPPAMNAKRLNILDLLLDYGAAIAATPVLIILFLLLSA